MGRKELSIKAADHNRRMYATRSQEIEDAIMRTFYHDESTPLKPVFGQTENMSFVQSDTVSAAYMQPVGKRVAVLNFASYKHPGGQFLDGSSAQEEALCHESVLYEVLAAYKVSYYEKNQREGMNYGYYRNRLLYSEGVLFEREGSERWFDVITCAAPNMRSIEYHPDKIAGNSQALTDRIDFMLSVASSYNPDVIVLGAWGCGVFKQDPKEVAEAFRCGLEKYRFENVVFAVPGNNANSAAFRNMFGK